MISKAIKEKWIAALESGEYKQASGVLKYDDPVKGTCHCSLGVLGELLGLEFIKPESVDYYTIDGNSCKLPSHILKDMVQARFMGMNDGEGMSFVEIATKLREMDDFVNDFRRNDDP